MSSPRELEFTLENGKVLRFPKSFGVYKYVRTLGSGTFSVVVLCEGRRSAQFAVKIFSRQLLVEEQLFDRFEREVRVLESLRHPNIIRLEEVVFGEQMIYLVMEFCERGELYHFIGNYRLINPQVVARIFREITEAIYFIHSRDIVHRDLKPENILLDTDMRPRLADFGLCHTNAHQRLLKTPCGSPVYACPEILAQIEYDGKAADIWSLGIVLYAMVVGELPWRAGDINEIFTEIQEEDVQIPSHLDEAVQELLRKMLSRNPADRPPADQILRHPWLAQTVVYRLPLLK
jgi:serine/threonine protein kinase